MHQSSSRTSPGWRTTLGAAILTVTLVSSSGCAALVPKLRAASLEQVERGGTLVVAGDFAAADAAFTQAMRLRGGEMAWHAYDAYAAVYRGSGVRRWGQRVLEFEFPRRSAPGIEVDPHVFGPYPYLASDIMAIDAGLVIDSDDDAGARSALEAAQERLALVATDGVEYPDWDAVHAAAANDVWTTVVYVDDYPDGPGLSFDSEDAWSGAMARTALYVVIDELTAAGITEAVVLPASAPRPAAKASTQPMARTPAPGERTGA